MRLLPLIVGLALLGTLASVFALSRNPAPVQYPPDWPPGWLHAPRGASAAALPASLELNRTMLAESHPWHPVDSMGVANEGRSWHVGFAYAGSFDAAQRDIAGQLRGRGWSEHMGNGVCEWFAADRLWRIELSHLPARTEDDRQWPESWELSVHEYRQPVDYLPAAKEATPLD
ncbi:MAG: hypothetical protein H7A35_03650 [Planctomycetales bacterium]|nr:hypothetical protein [bacterium]UNM09150.1 MAG: hypothetical protein H7A35_03650 [Planctomycetales bacterium]